MAIGRLSVCTGAKGKASAHAQYIAREGKYEKDPKIEKLEHTEVGNMPKWAESDPNFFWKMSDEHERKNGSTYREHVITLPRELNEAQRLALIHDWIKQEIGDKFAYQFAIHNPKAMDGKEQPHCHLMFSERTIDGIERDPDQYFRRYNAKNPDRGGAKKANTGIAPADRKAELSEQRDRWERMCNSHLELANQKARISMKSLKDRGYKHPPVNLTMAQIQTPEIRAVYMAELTAKRSYTAVAKERNQIDIPIERELQERQKRLADLAKIREAAQQKTAQAAEKATQPARQAQQAAEKAEQERLEQQAAEKAEESQRIESRTAYQLLKLQLVVKVTKPCAYGDPTLLKHAITPIGKDLYMLLNQAKNKGWDITINNSDSYGTRINQDIAQNPTAIAFERFMLRAEVLSNPDIYNDFVVRLGIREFSDKYGIACNSEDLKQLDRLNPDPKLTPPQPQPEQKIEREAKNDYDLDL